MKTGYLSLGCGMVYGGVTGHLWQLLEVPPGHLADDRGLDLQLGLLHPGQPGGRPAEEIGTCPETAPGHPANWESRTQEGEGSWLSAHSGHTDR